MRFVEFRNLAELLGNIDFLRHAFPQSLAVSWFEVSGFRFVVRQPGRKTSQDPSSVRTLASWPDDLAALELPCFMRRFRRAEIVLIWPQRIPFPRCFHAATPFSACHRTVYLIFFIRRASSILQWHEPWPRREP